MNIFNIPPKEERIKNKIAIYKGKVEKLYKDLIKENGNPLLSKREDFNEMQYSYTDSNGLRYFSYLNPFKTPIMRFVNLSKAFQELTKAIDTDEEDLMWKSIEKALQGNKETNDKPDIGMIGFIVTERKARKKYLVHEDIMLKIVSCLYIREDQDPSKWDEELESEKIQQFKKDIDNMYLFFCESGMNKLYPSLNRIEKEYPKLSLKTKNKVKALEKVMNDYILDP